MLYLFEIQIHDNYSAEQYASAWVRASKLIQQAPGARGTRLHRKIGDDKRLLAVASWESKQQRDAMEAAVDEQLRQIIRSQLEFIDVNILGEYDDPEWVVLPSADQ